MKNSVENEFKTCTLDQIILKLFSNTCLLNIMILSSMFSCCSEKEKWESKSAITNEEAYCELCGERYQHLNEVFFFFHFKPC